ncbi:MAG TPA: energy transducer TonB [Terracidiphilus sp.]|jgi:TonB family protein|nr:energy transducer TonB [Terracidiphilus sp.]
MANELLTQTEAETRSGDSPYQGHELDAFLGKAFDEKPIWTGLYESIRDVFFPPKLPPLELTSTPIPVPDRMAVKANPWAIGISTTMNLLIAIIVLFYVGKKVIEEVKPALITPIQISDFKAPKDLKMAGGGGGGGDHSIVQASKGKLPQIEKQPVVPPQVQTFDKPKIPMQAAIEVQKNITLPDNPTMPMIGMKTSTNNVVLSNGTGGGGGMGTGAGGGLGSGSGNGYGPGSGGNTGGGVYQIGGRVSAPVALNSVEAEFSDEARRAKYQGVVLISLIVDANGMPQNARVVRALGMGLDEKALEAVRKYRFKPAMLDGKTPVPVPITVEVNFRLY